MRDFRELEIWAGSLNLVKRVYQMTNDFPNHERFGLCTQMNRAAISIVSNIAEGCSRKTVIEFSRFLDISLGSSFELETQIEVSKQVGFLNDEVYDDFLQELNKIQRQINAFRGKLK